MEKKDKGTIEITESDIRDLKVPKMVSWKASSHDMTEEELERIKNLNWEWYYNCYLYIDEIIPISCKRCAHINVFQPGEKEKICENCGAETRRCEKEEKI
ncbi:MAG TPA: hypothetical protein VFG19_00700 [Geobacteraceae bacterium]|nr:hypothetical protein [Geobacteraceae bacterium]